MLSKQQTTRTRSFKSLFFCYITNPKNSAIRFLWDLYAMLVLRTRAHVEVIKPDSIFRDTNCDEIIDISF